MAPYRFCAPARGVAAAPRPKGPSKRERFTKEDDERLLVPRCRFRALATSKKPKKASGNGSFRAIPACRQGFLMLFGPKEWVRKNPGKRHQGKELWVRAVNALVTKHSWQSMQNRYRRHLMLKESKEGIKEGIEQFAAKRKAPEPERRRLTLLLGDPERRLDLMAFAARKVTPSASFTMICPSQDTGSTFQASSHVHVASGATVARHGPIHQRRS